MVREILKQNAEGMLKDIQEVGCFFKCAVAIAEKEQGCPLTAEENNKIWEVAINEDYIINREMVKGGAVITNLAFKLMTEKYGEHPKKCIEIGTRRNGKITFYEGVKEEYKDDECYIIHKLRMPKSNPFPNHFVLSSWYMSTKWDPHSPKLKAEGTVYDILYKVIRI